MEFGFLLFWEFWFVDFYFDFSFFENFDLWISILISPLLRSLNRCRQKDFWGKVILMQNPAQCDKITFPAVVNVHLSTFLKILMSIFLHLKMSMSILLHFWIYWLWRLVQIWSRKLKCGIVDTSDIRPPNIIQASENSIIWLRRCLQ